MIKFDKFLPSGQLRPFISHFVVTESELEKEYKVIPSTGLVIGFQYKGQLSAVSDNQEKKLRTAGISGIADSYQLFRNSPGIGTVLVYFTEIGFTHFSVHPANELFNLNLGLEEIFDPAAVREVEEKLASAATDQQRIRITEQFLLSQLKDIQTDRLVMESLRLIYESKGTIRIKELNKKLFISQSPFEKRFRKVVGTSPGKFASIVRLNNVIESLDRPKSLTEICYENHFFDQAHFIKAFKRFTGQTPGQFKSSR